MVVVVLAGLCLDSGTSDGVPSSCSCAIGDLWLGVDGVCGVPDERENSGELSGVSESVPAVARAEGGEAEETASSSASPSNCSPNSSKAGADRCSLCLPNVCHSSRPAIIDLRFTNRVSFNEGLLPSVSPEAFLRVVEPEPLRVLGVNATISGGGGGGSMGIVDNIGDVGDDDDEKSSSSSGKFARKESGSSRILRSSWGRRNGTGDVGGDIGRVSDVAEVGSGVEVWELVHRLRKGERMNDIVCRIRGGICKLINLNGAEASVIRKDNEVQVRTMCIISTPNATPYYLPRNIDRKAPPLNVERQP